MSIGRTHSKTVVSRFLHTHLITRIVLTDVAETLVKLDDGCTEPGILEASLNRPWTWTVLDALSRKKHEAEIAVQEQEKDSDKEAA